MEDFSPPKHPWIVKRVVKSAKHGGFFSMTHGDSEFSLINDQLLGWDVRLKDRRVCDTL